MEREARLRALHPRLRRRARVRNARLQALLVATDGRTTPRVERRRKLVNEAERHTLLVWQELVREGCERMARL